MKKIALIITSLLIGSMIITGCSKKDSAANDNNSGGGGDTPSKTMVFYKIDIENGQYPTANVFKYTIIYYVAENDSVIVNDVTLPWVSPEFEVTEKPFWTKFKGIAYYNVEDIPDGPFSFSYRPKIFENGQVVWSSAKDHNFESKEFFLERIAAHPTLMNFMGQHHIY